MPSREARRQVALAQGLEFDEKQDATPAAAVQGVVVGRRKGAGLVANPWLLRTKALMLLTPSPEYLHREMRITPEMVSAMATKLGINTDPPTFANPEPEYFLLWLAVEALRAPLPAPWRYVKLEHDIPGEGWLAGDACYEDAISLERTTRHPLIGAFKEQAGGWRQG